MSHQGTLLRCGWYWKIKQTIPATHNRVAHSAESHETSTVCRIRSSVKVMPWAGQVLPTSTPKMPLADRHNLMCVGGRGVKTMSQAPGKPASISCFSSEGTSNFVPFNSFSGSLRTVCRCHGNGDQQGCSLRLGLSMAHCPQGSGTSAPAGRPDPGQPPGHHRNHKG